MDENTEAYLADRPHGRKWLVRWREVIGPAECPYMHRWFVETPLGSLRLHHFLRGDNDRALHDHPWGFVTLILRGGYIDWHACEHCAGWGTWQNEAWGKEIVCAYCGGSGEFPDEVRPGAVRYRPARWRHRVETDGSWSLVLTGPVVRAWGFWVDGAFQPMRAYFARHGFAPCE